MHDNCTLCGVDMALHPPYNREDPVIALLPPTALDRFEAMGLVLWSSRDHDFSNKVALITVMHPTEWGTFSANMQRWISTVGGRRGKNFVAAAQRQDVHTTFMTRFMTGHTVKTHGFVDGFRLVATATGVDPPVTRPEVLFTAEQLAVLQYAHPCIYEPKFKESFIPWYQKKLSAVHTPSTPSQTSG